MARANINLAGNVSYTSKDNYAWIVDTGATNHMISNARLLLSGAQIGNTGSVQLPTGEIAQYHVLVIASLKVVSTLLMCFMFLVLSSISYQFPR